MAPSCDVCNLNLKGQSRTSATTTPRGTAFRRLRNVTKLFGNANDDDLVAAQNVAPIVVPTTDAMAATRLIYRDELDPGVDKRRQDIAGRVAAGDWPVHTCRH